MERSEIIARNNRYRKLTTKLTKDLKAPLAIDMVRWGLTQWYESGHGLGDLVLVPGKVPDLSWEFHSRDGVRHPCCEELSLTYEYDALKNAVLQQAAVMGVELQEAG